MSTRLHSGIECDMTGLAYIRISTATQHLDQQRDALLAAGVLPEHIYEDTISGVKSSRPGLDALLAYARSGDTVTVLRLDRLGRSLSMIFRTIERFEERGIVLRSLREHIDLSTTSGRLMAGVLASIAAYERDLMRERVAEARASATVHGRRPGRKAVLTPAQLVMARAARDSGQSPTDIARELGVSRATLYRVTASNSAV